MKDAQLYKLALYSVLGILTISAVASLLYVLLAGLDLLIFLAILAAVVIIAGAVGIGHLRMRMMFADLQRKLARSDLAHQEDVRRIGSDIQSVRQSLADVAPRAYEQPESKIFNHLMGIEREVVANDSFSEHRFSAIIGLLGSIQTNTCEVRSILDRNSEDRKEQASYLRTELSAEFQSYGTRADNIQSEHESVVKQYLDDIRKVQERTNSRLSSLVSVVKDTGWMANQFSKVLEDIDDLHGDMRSHLDSGDQRARTLKSVVERYARQFDAFAELHCEAQVAIEEDVAAMRSSMLASAALPEQVGRIEKSSKYEFMQLRRSYSELLATVNELGGNVANFRKDILTGLDELQANFDSTLTEELRHVAQDARISDIENSIGSEFRELRERWAGVVSGPDSVGNAARPLHFGVTTSESSDSQEDLDDSYDMSQYAFSRLEAMIGSELTKLSAQSQKFFNATQNKLEYQRAASEELPKDVSDYASLLARFNIRSTDGPDLGGWSATVPVIATLVNEILEHPAGGLSSLDVGSGTSTFWSALAMRERGEGKCFALEHNPSYASSLRDMLRKHSLERWVEIVDAPLVEWHPRFQYLCDSSMLPKQWYQTDALKGHEFGLVFVDGPPGDSGVYSRLPAVEELWNGLTDESVIILDDTIRSEERKIAELWASLDLPDGKVEVKSHLVKSTILRVSR